MGTHVLIVDDDPNLCTVLETGLVQQGYQVTICQMPAEALGLAEEGDVDVILTDVNMHGMSGTELCSHIVASERDIPVIVMTAFGSMDSAIDALHAGAFDYVTKPLDMLVLATTLDRGAKERALREEVRRLRHEVEGDRFEDMAGSSPAMAQAFQLIERVSKSDVTVLVTGESGTGKELAAKAIHARSSRAEGPFIAINCAAMPESLLESELFGHVRGAFTDAHQAKKGLFLNASGGTLFLDEIGEMPLGMQVKLLRALQERKVRAVGGDVEVPFDARIVAATNRDLEAEVEAKRFREDLFYRINVVRVPLPPLRERGRDILTLAKNFLRSCQQGSVRVVGFTPAAVDALLSYSWPGNVRELQNCMQRATALAEFDHIGIEDLRPTIDDPKDTRVGSLCDDDSNALITAEELERRYIGEVLEAVGGNKTVAARILGFDRRTLYRKLDAYAEATATPSFGSARQGDAGVGQSSPEWLAASRRPLVPSRKGARSDAAQF